MSRKCSVICLGVEGNITEEIFRELGNEQEMVGKLEGIGRNMSITEEANRAGMNGK